MTTEPEPGSHGEPYRAEQIDYGEYSAYRIFAADGTRIAHIMSGQRLAAWLDHAILCMNACHKARVRRPEELAEFIAEYWILRNERACLCSFGPEECDECADWARVDRKLAALEGKG